MKKKYKSVPLFILIHCVNFTLHHVIWTVSASVNNNNNYASSSTTHHHLPDGCEQITFTPPSTSLLSSLFSSSSSQSSSYISSSTSTGSGNVLNSPIGSSTRSSSTSSSSSSLASSSSSSSSSSPHTATSATNLNSVTYLCKIQTLSGTFDVTRIPSTRTQSLYLLCSTNNVYENFLYQNSFNHLRELTQLTIEGCKFEKLPSGLFNSQVNLTNLTIRTFNDWDVGIPLLVPSDLLQPLQRLQRIDLSYNQLSTLPDRLFCGLDSLLFINLTHNQFSEIENLGLSTKRIGGISSITGGISDQQRTWPASLMSTSCINNTTQSLDLSHNRLRVLTDRSFDTLPQLRTLRLNNNQIQRAEDSSLAGLHELNILDLSNNGLVALPARFFSPVVNSLRELYLQNNSISVLPPGQFEYLKEVVLLNLSHNKITDHWINSDTFVKLINLVKLDLSYNKLKKIDSSTFRSQSMLETLLLHHNEIEIIADSAFSSLHQLQKLVLSHNHLTKLDSSYCFTGLSSLNNLYLDHNRLEYIHLDTFHNLTNLMELNLSHNWLRKSVPTALSYLHSLLSLDLSHNHLTDISNASYKSNHLLYELHLESNKIGSLNRGVFADLPLLRILNLANNDIDSIGQGTFNEVPDLHVLRLDSNRLTSINELFTDLRDLLMLNISANRIAWFDYAHIPTGLQSLDIHDNQIESLGNHYHDQVEYMLKFLDASSNRISSISRSSLPGGIEVVILNNNSISRIEPATFHDKQNLTRVDLTYNRLTTLDINAFRLSKDRRRRSPPEFNVSKNPYACDCTMEWVHDLKSNDEYPRIVDRSDIICEFAFKRRLTRSSLLDVDPSMLLCSYKSHCFALCHCCEFDHCDCEMTCPENCTCYYDRSWNVNIVDCSGSRHVMVPPRIPMDATQVFLDGNDLPVMSSNTFIGRKNMKILHLNASNIQIINNRTFNGLTVLEELNLSHNQLTILYGYEFEALVNLTRLDLSHNRIRTIENNTFANNVLLQVLLLHHNSIHNFELWSLNYNHRLIRLTLSANPWSCECNFINYAISWIQDRSTIISDSSRLQCIFNETLRLSLSPEFNASSCTNYSAASNMLARQFQVETYMPIVAISGFVLFTSVFIVLLIYRREMSVWFFSRFGVRLHGRSVSKREEEKLYDAFISYSKKDEAFVSQVLAPEMEYGNPPYRMCLLYRDLPVASGYLSDAIVNAMEASQRTIIVLSENFLKGEWCRYEFRSSHLEVLRTTRQRLIIISFGKICPKDLDPDMRFWLKSSTILQWGEKLFWEKLRYALPDIAYTRKPAEQTRDMTVSVNI